MGEPDFPTPENIVQAGVRALREGKTKYTPSAGIPELREAIAAHVSATRGVSFTPDQGVVAGDSRSGGKNPRLKTTDPLGLETRWVLFVRSAWAVTLAQVLYGS